MQKLIKSICGITHTVNTQRRSSLYLWMRSITLKNYTTTNQMRVGIIGLGRMGEGMSRRMIKEGIETVGYRRNYDKVKELQESGGITEAADSLETLVRVVKKDSLAGEVPGIFQLVIPAELVEDTINELLPLLDDGDIIIDHGNSNFKDSRRRSIRLEKLGIQYLDCGTSGGVYGLERGYCLMVGGSDHAVSVCSPIFKLPHLVSPLHPHRPI